MARLNFQQIFFDLAKCHTIMPSIRFGGSEGNVWTIVGSFWQILTLLDFFRPFWTFWTILVHFGIFCTTPTVYHTLYDHLKLHTQICTVFTMCPKL